MTFWCFYDISELSAPRVEYSPLEVAGVSKTVKTRKVVENGNFMKNVESGIRGLES